MCEFPFPADYVVNDIIFCYKILRLGRRMIAPDDDQSLRVNFPRNSGNRHRCLIAEARPAGDREDIVILCLKELARFPLESLDLDSRLRSADGRLQVMILNLIEPG